MEMSTGYEFQKIGERYDGHPVYLVRKADGSAIGVIQRCRASTDTQIKGTRLRRPGKGRNEWQLGCWKNRDTDEYDASVSYPSGVSYLTRADAAWSLERDPMPADVVSALAQRVQS